MFDRAYTSDGSRLLQSFVTEALYRCALEYIFLFFIFPTWLVYFIIWHIAVYCGKWVITDNTTLLPDSSFSCNCLLVFFYSHRMSLMMLMHLFCIFSLQSVNYTVSQKTTHSTSWAKYNDANAFFRLDALALSVIGTTTWLAGWLAGCHTPVLYQNR